LTTSLGSQILDEPRLNRINSTFGVEAEERDNPQEAIKGETANSRSIWGTAFDDDGSVEVLHVTSRETKRWIIPKGWPIKGLKPSKAAAREAYEEAGVRGRIAGRAFGHYVYEKLLEDSIMAVPCQVEVFPLAVKRQSKNWPESKQRTARWFPAAEAAALVENGRLHDLIRQFETRKASGRQKWE
jgi:8-oxo-dGTP pyrophosphatase MutT (NUDIX family)